MADWNITTVLVTGATGFVGAHIVDELLRRGIKVRAAARSRGKAEQMLRDRPQYKDLLEFTFLNDLAEPHAFDEAVKSVDAIIHTASPVSLGESADLEASIMKPAIAGTQSILETAKTEPRVRRIVITSSMSAVVDPALGAGAGHIYSGAEWCPVSYADGAQAGAPPITAYRAAKKYAERAAWDCVRADPAPHFDLVTFCPPMVYGPVVHPVARVADLNASSAGLWRHAGCGEAAPAGALTACWVDVRDLAYAHVEAVVRPGVGNRRYTIAAPGHFTWAEAIAALRATFPWAKEELKEMPLEEPDVFLVDGEAAAKDLGFSYREFRETVIDAIGQFKQIELQSKQT